MDAIAFLQMIGSVGAGNCAWCFDGAQREMIAEVARRRLSLDTEGHGILYLASAT